MFKKALLLTATALLLLAMAPYSMGYTYTISNTPDLPIINWPAGTQAPKILTDRTDLTPCDRVLIVWTSAEWAALMHVFCFSDKTMPYKFTKSPVWNSGNPTGWINYSYQDSQYQLPYDEWPKGTVTQLPYWFQYTYVDLGNNISVCIIKANVHLDATYYTDATKSQTIPGETVFNEMLDLINNNVKPKLFITTGTGGGGSTFQTLGTSIAVSSATYQTPAGSKDQSAWPTYTSNWLPKPNLNQVLAMSMTVPVTQDDLNSIVTQFNKQEAPYSYGPYTLAQLDPDNLLYQAYPAPMCDYTYQTNISLLTCSDFLTGTNDNLYGKYAFLEMDDAVIFKYYQNSGVTVGAIRDLSDPVQNVNLPSDVQGNWGNAIYSTYGFYTAYNSALLSWACLVTGNIAAPQE